MQVKLLRAIQEKVIRKVGGNEETSVDVRIIAATNKDLNDLVAEGRFREDLFYRINVIPIALPPLRSRTEDIAPLLVEHFLDRMSAELGRKADGISRDAMSMLMSYPFPGNVRELRNIVERAMVCASGPILQVSDFGIAEVAAQAAAPATLEDVEHRHIAAILDHCGGNVSQAARILDIDRVTLYNKIGKRYGLREPTGK